MSQDLADMKSTLIPLILLAASLSHSLAGNWFGSGPWANATYYPGNLDGKYQAAVYGNNISGVLGFALRDGAPTISTNTSTTSAGSTNSSTSTTVVDPLQNYFVIFVEGRSYSGLTTASINYDNSTVTGGLIGAQPNFSFLTNGTNFQVTSTLITNITTTNQTTLVTNNGVVTETNVFFTNTSIATVLVTNAIPSTVLDPAALVNRGLNGGYRADIGSKKSTFTFNGNGELSTPSQLQTVKFTTNAAGSILGAQIQTATVPFQLNGIRVSFSSGSTAATSSTLSP
jgi:hypothetical protein